MLIPVFVSCPTRLSTEQDAARRLILGELGHAGLEARTVGRSDYPTSFPLREVLTLARHCSGGLILGFRQFEATAGIWKEGTPDAARISKQRTVSFASPWNHIEAGILFALKLPLMVFRESGVTGGVFDLGATDLFVHSMLKAQTQRRDRTVLRAVLRKWASHVEAHYYADR